MRKSRRNITIVNNEIDYDKLAEAIVKANAIHQEQYSPSREWMKYILIPIFWGVAILSGILAVAMFVSLCQHYNMQVSFCQHVCVVMSKFNYYF